MFHSESSRETSNRKRDTSWGTWFLNFEDHDSPDLRLRAVYTIDVLNDREKLSRWIVPVQIMQILYVVLIIYFIVNTGQISIYLVGSSHQENNRLQYCSLHPNLVHRKGTHKGSRLPDSTPFFSFLWIYGLAFSVYIVFFCLFITRGLVALAMRDEDRKSALFTATLFSPEFLSSLVSFYIWFASFRAGILLYWHFQSLVCCSRSQVFSCFLKQLLW